MQNPEPLSARRLGLWALGMFSLFLALHYLCLALYPKAELDVYGISDFYPLSVFNFRIPRLEQLLGAAGLGLFFWRLWPRLGGKAQPLWLLIYGGLSLAFFSNLLHGWRYGIDYPTATWGDGGIEYYHDAILLKGPLWFLERCNAIQFELLEHARTHPPGPVLLYYFLAKIFRDPGLISVALALLSLALGLRSLKRLLILAFGSEPRGALLLYAILPAILIYGLAVVDAVIASVFLAALVNFLDEKKKGSVAWAGFWLSLSLFFTFGALFLLPVMLGWELLRRKSAARFAVAAGFAVLLLLALKIFTNFDWLAAFLKASAMENEKGFLLFADPRRYLWYRIGAVAEILFFFTPFLCLLAWQGRAALKAKSPDFYAFSWLGLATLAALLLSGAMKIGEAARICIFILPFLFLPAMAAWHGLKDGARARAAYAVFAWSLVMQLFGFYQW